MNEITRETRRMAWEKQQEHISCRQREILEAMGSDELTVDDIVRRLMERGVLRYYDRNAVAPRMTELLGAGLVEITCARVCERTRRLCSVWRAA